MKKGTCFAAAAVLLLAAGVAFFFIRPPGPAPVAPALAAIEEPAPPPAQREPGPAVPAPPPEAASRPDVPVAEVSADAQAPEALTIRAGDILAVVNGVAVLGSDLVPVPADRPGEPVTLSPAMYDFLLRRAIRREVVAQAAKSKNVELGTEALRGLAEARARLEKTDPNVIVPAGVDRSKVEFELRDIRSLLLQAALLEAEGIRAPHVTAEDVDRYYQSHRAEYGELPEDPDKRAAARQAMDYEIRQRLAPALQSQYQQQAEACLGRLTAGARVEIKAAAP